SVVIVRSFTTVRCEHPATTPSPMTAATKDDVLIFLLMDVPPFGSVVGKHGTCRAGGLELPSSSRARGEHLACRCYNRRDRLGVNGDGTFLTSRRMRSHMHRTMLALFVGGLAVATVAGAADLPPAE